MKLECGFFAFRLLVFAFAFFCYCHDGPVAVFNLNQKWKDLTWRTCCCWFISPECCFFGIKSVHSEEIIVKVRFDFKDKIFYVRV